MLLYCFMNVYYAVFIIQKWNFSFERVKLVILLSFTIK